MQTKYFRHRNFSEDKVNVTLSIWKQLKFVDPFIKEDMGWCGGDGQSIQVWTDKWVDKIVNENCTRNSLIKPQGYNTQLLSEYMHTTSRRWVIDMLKRDFRNEGAFNILRIKLHIF